MSVIISLTLKLVAKEYKTKLGNKDKKYMQILCVDSFHHLPTSQAGVFDNLDGNDRIHIHNCEIELSKCQRWCFYKKARLPIWLCGQWSEAGRNISTSSGCLLQSTSWWAVFRWRLHKSAESLERIYKCMFYSWQTSLKFIYKFAKKYYWLDPIHYPTAPWLSCYAAFKFTRAEVDLITDIQMMRDFVSRIRGGMMFVNKHIIEANYREMSNNDPLKLISYLILVGANNLWGHQLRMKLPQKDFITVPIDQLVMFD